MKFATLIFFAIILMVLSGVFGLAILQESNLQSPLISEMSEPSTRVEKALPRSVTEAPYTAEFDTSQEETGMSNPEKSSKPLDLPYGVNGFVLFDYAGNDPGWYTVNDDVMGGVSNSFVNTDQDRQRLTFAGNLSLENNGGFASIRSQYTDYDLRQYDGIALRVLGDGNVYRFRIRTEATGPSIAYTAWFKTQADSWQEIYIPFSKMIPLYRGQIVQSAGPIDPASIRSFGFMLADKQQGEFMLEVDWISALSVSRTDIKYVDSNLDVDQALS